MASRYLLFLLLLTVISSLSKVLGQAPEISFWNRTDPPVYHAYWPVCSSTDNYTQASQYQVNLANLTASLPPAALDNRGFNTSMAGDAPDMVFGLIMCYADRNITQCKKCLEAAAAGIQQTCPLSRDARACYDACVLGYSRQPFFSVADLDVAFYAWALDPYPIDYVKDGPSMNGTRMKLMSQLAAKAPVSELRLANGTQPYKDSLGKSHAMYGLAQCTRYLNASECSRCLDKFVAELMTPDAFPNNTYGAVKGFSCYVVYQVDRDLGITILPPREETPQTRTPQSSPPFPLPFSPVGSPPPTRGTPAMVAGVTIAAGALVICASLSVWFFLRQSRQKKMVRRQELEMFDEQPMEEEEFEKGAGSKRFRYNELAVATKHFSEQEKLGEGGFGSVYRGYLKDEDLHVAVKRISKDSKQGKKEYAAEVKIISRLRHRNLVQLIGWCHGSGELLLVYELMPNGSLDTHIYSQKNTLQWPRRHEIVLGLGSALVYLHHEWEQCVLHQDIKPSNLMLDASFNVKLGDFGLARLVNHGQESHTTKLAGTMGYMDAECMVTGRSSTESDVYSFGVVVLEIICGRHPIGLVLRGKESITVHLVQRVWELYGDGRILDAADPRLNNEFDNKEMERVMVAALWCAHPDMNLRPSMREAVNVMQFQAPLPSLPTKMPVATFVPPIERCLSD